MKEKTEWKQLIFLAEFKLNFLISKKVQRQNLYFKQENYDFEDKVFFFTLNHDVSVVLGWSVTIVLLWCHFLNNIKIFIEVIAIS